ncbi:MAG TPA: hypothetical protein VK891_16830, partial [Euzebyales bacterium]|nr:hypothetical protein [Euzebyales bacterium]
NSDGPADVRARVLAMHRFLAATPSLLVAGALWDAIGDPRQPNVPGTVDTYPNWRLPLARPTSDGPEPVTLEAVMRSEAVREMIGALRRERPHGPSHRAARRTDVRHRPTDLA